jgi:2,4-dienoyl-CoA reductase (NADPH2)
VVATNRINRPEVAEELLARGVCDMVSMARPLLADPEFVNKAAARRSDEIITCIACNQACLDHTFSMKRATCMLNPRSGYETELNPQPVAASKRIAVVGAGPAGLAFSVEASRRGHRVTLFEQSKEIGGQFNLAKRIPGKEEFHETLRYYARQLELLEVEVRLGTRAEVSALKEGFDEVVLATGVMPRRPSIAGLDHPKVLSYLDVLLHDRAVGKRVAIVGAGGIGFDVAEFLVHSGASPTLDPPRWLQEWGVDPTIAVAGAVEGVGKHRAPPARKIYLLQRKAEALGKRLGKTTGWVHRATLKDSGVEMLGGVSYERIDDAGLHLQIEGQPRLLEVDHVILCAGQEPQRELASGLESAGARVHLIGGAHLAAELDAKAAIRQATELAFRL